MNRRNTEQRVAPDGTRRPGRPRGRTAPGATKRQSGSRTFLGDSPVLRSYLTEIRRYPVLAREEEAKLAREAQAGRRAALDRLIECNLRFVVKIASGYRNCGLPFEDLIAEGNLGLIEAVHRFDPERGVKLISCAVWWIRRYIRKALSDQSRVVRLPTSQIRRMSAVRKTEKKLREDLGREPTWEETTKKLSRKPTDADPIDRNGVRFLNLDEPVGEQDRALSESLGDDRQLSVEAQMVDREETGRIIDLYKQLDRQQRTVISCRFGLDGEQRLTLVELGKRIGKSREGVRQIERNALRQLRQLSMASSCAASGPIPAIPTVGPAACVSRSTEYSSMGVH